MFCYCKKFETYKQTVCEEPEGNTDKIIFFKKQESIKIWDLSN